MDDEFDLIIVGAGPAGTAAAIEARRLGVRRVLVLERERWPRRKVCAGGLSPRARIILRRAGLWDKVAPLVYPVIGLRMVLAGGRDASFVGAATASIMNRRELDGILGASAVTAGARLVDATRVDGFIEEKGRVVGVRAGGRQITGRWVVVAAGARSRSLGCAPPGRTVDTLAAWYDGADFTPNVVEMIYDPEIAPHFGWLFPESDGRVAIGVIAAHDRPAPGPITALFERFIDRHFGRRLVHADRLGPPRGHPIFHAAAATPAGPPGVLLCGEAAGLVSVATFEGISYALESGAMAGRAVAAALATGAADDAAARAYGEDVRRRLGSRLAAAKVLPRFGAASIGSILHVEPCNAARHRARRARAGA